VRTNVKKDFLVTNGMKSCQSSSWKVTSLALNSYNSTFQVKLRFPEIVEYFSNRYNSNRFTQIGIVIVGIINFNTGSCPSDNSCFSGGRYCLVKHKVQALSYMF
jgi:hypothetical protein